MPTVPALTYRAHSEPPRWWEHAFSHPHALALAWASVLVGAASVAAAIVDEFNPSPALAAQPWWSALCAGLLLVIGGGAALAGYQGRWRTLELAIDVLRVGLFGQAMGWLWWAVALIAAPGDTYWLTVILSSCVCVGNAIAFCATWWIKRDLTHAAQRLRVAESARGGTDEPV